MAPLRDRVLDLAGRPDAVAAMRRTLCEAERAARAAIQEVVKLLDIDPADSAAGCRATIKVRKPVNQDEKLSALAA